jgi:hypothetical protein
VRDGGKGNRARIRRARERSDERLHRPKLAATIGGEELTGATEAGMIEVRCTGQGDPLQFEVVVREGKGESRHQVTMAQETYERLTAGKHARECFVEAAFRFLLDREPKEAILGRFDMTVISRYFPEFEQELPHYLSRS